MLDKTLKVSRLLDLYGGLLTDKQREVLDMYYNCDMSLSEVGEELSISRQGVRDALNRAVNALVEVEEKVGALKILTQLRTSLERLADGADKVEADKVMEIAKGIEV